MDRRMLLNNLADTSQEQCAGMKEVLSQLNNELGASSLDSFTNLFARYQAIEAEARNTDLLLNTQLEKMSGEAIRNCFGSKLDVLHELQAEVKVEIQKSITRANNVKSLLAHEMGAVVKGRAAMNGYRSQSSKHGRILSRSF